MKVEFIINTMFPLRSRYTQGFCCHSPPWSRVSSTIVANSMCHYLVIAIFGHCGGCSLHITQSHFTNVH